METLKSRPYFFKNRFSGRQAFAKAKDGVKVLIVGICALLALGLFTSSEQLNAG